MKITRAIILTSATFIITAFSSAFAAADSDSFLEPDKSYNIEYLLPPKVVSEANLPRFVTIIKHGQNEWYYVKRADGVDHNMWINFSGVLSVEEQTVSARPSNAAANP